MESQGQADHILLLARHGQTDWNVVRRMQGRSDTELNAVGRGQARALAEALRAEKLDRALVSPLRRALQTAEAVRALRPDGPEFEVEPRLAEADMGEFEGRLDEELLETEEFRAWRRDPVRYPPPGGEGALDVARRVAPLLDELAAGRRGSRTLLLGHQFTLAVVNCLVTGVPLDQVRTLLATPGEVRQVALPARHPRT